MDESLLTGGTVPTRRGYFTSGWLQNLIRESGGVMNVTTRTVIAG